MGEKNTDHAEALEAFLIIFQQHAEWILAELTPKFMVE
jgi:hypothetical protein